MKKFFPTLLLLLSCGLSAVAQPSGNPLVFGENRLTLITPTLFRLEFARDGKFIDDPTIFAYDRSNLLPADRFEVRALGGDRYEITTEALRIVYEHDGFPFGLHNFAAYYKLNGKEKKFTNRCIFRNNLGGPVETLDRVTGEIPMQDGLLSRDGWYVIDDERSDLLVDGWLRPRDTRSHVQDQYCFVYGNDYKAALADLGAIGGRVPMTRKYIHGVWYCRYWDYTSEEFLSIIDGYEQNDFPLDNLVFDMGWHTYTARTGTGHAGSRSWTGYTWERERIPDPEALIAEVHRRGVTVSLHDHPHDGSRPHEEMYGAFMKDMGADPAKPLLFDLGDRKYMETFFKHAHHTTEDMGVDFWWLDWQQNYLYPEVRGYRSTSLQWINELYYRETERKGLRGAGYSRWAGWGDHRHPIQFSGDAQANWEMLAFEVKLTAASGNAGSGQLVLTLAVFQHLGHFRRHFHLHAPADLVVHAVDAHEQIALVPAVVLEQPDSYVFLVHFFKIQSVHKYIPGRPGRIPLRFATVPKRHFGTDSPGKSAHACGREPHRRRVPLA